MAFWYVSPNTGSDANAGTSWATAFKTYGKAGSVHAGGDTIYGNAGTDTQTSASANVPGGYLNLLNGTAAAPTQLIGCTSVVGDLEDVDVKDNTNAPVIKSFSGGANRVLSVNQYAVVKNFVIDGSSVTNWGVLLNATNVELKNIKTLNPVAYGFYFSGSSINGSRLLAIGGMTGFNITARINLRNIAAIGYSVSGASLSGDGTSITRFVFANGTSTSDGVYLTGTTIFLEQGSVYGNTRDGIRNNSGNNVITRGLIIYGNTSIGQNNLSTNIMYDSDYNSLGNNGTNFSNVTPGTNDLTNLSSNPFVSPTGTINTLSDVFNNFALNAYGLSLCKGNSSPVFLDRGAVQHLDSGVINKLLLNQCLNNF